MPPKYGKRLGGTNSQNLAFRLSVRRDAVTVTDTLTRKRCAAGARGDKKYSGPHTILPGCESLGEENSLSAAAKATAEVARVALVLPATQGNPAPKMLAQAEVDMRLRGVDTAVNTPSPVRHGLDKPSSSTAGASSPASHFAIRVLGGSQGIFCSSGSNGCTMDSSSTVCWTPMAWQRWTRRRRGTPSR